MTTPAGIDPTALAGWFKVELPDIFDLTSDEPLTATLITGGKSNLTYVVTDGTAEVVVRRPPLGHVLATAHDMAREYEVMRALGPTAVPVPTMLGFCDVPQVMDTPFYVMEKVPGTAYRRAAELAALGPDRTRAIVERLVDTLVELHRVDPREVGLEHFGRPHGYLERQVRRWQKQLEASRSRPIDGIDELAHRLEHGIPTGGDTTIVHGDFRLDNVLVDALVDHDEITAVVDWEMSTLGDPLSDLALMLAYQQLGAVGDAVSDVSTAPGHPSLTEVVERYASRSGRDVGDLGFHRGLAFFKLAVILEGIHLRYTRGQTVGAGFEHIGDLIGPIVASGLEATAR